MPKIKLECPGHEQPLTADYQIEGSTFSALIQDQSYQGTWVSTGPGEGWLSCQGKILPFYMTQQDNTLSIWFEGGTYQLNLISGAARQSGKAGAAALQGGDIKAPMPGTVLKIPVQAGQTVEPNQPLVIMESMKMEMTLSAPAAATVLEVCCTESQLVDMGAILVKLDLG